MAALEGDAELHFDDQNNVEIQFIDEEDLPLANFIEHRASDEEFYSGASESSSDDSSEELEEEDHTDNEVELDEEVQVWYITIGYITDKETVCIF